MLKVFRINILWSLFTLEPSKYLCTLMSINWKIGVFTKYARTRQEVSTVYFAGNGAE